MNILQAEQILQKYDRDQTSVWTLSRLKIVLQEAQASFRKTIDALCNNHILVRVTRGVYLFENTVRNRRVVFGELIATLRRGEYCFEALESAAATWGIIPQTALGALTVMTTGRSGFFTTPYGPVEFVHTQATRAEIVSNTINRDDFISISSPEYTIHGLRRCGRVTELNEAVATNWAEA